jgi:hypothetical protein
LKKNVTSTFIISLSVIIIFSVAGIGYAAWGSAMNFSALISTGCLDMKFESFEIISETSPDNSSNTCISNIRISDDGKRLDIVIENACLGYSAEIKYIVRNDGDIPVYCSLDAGDNNVASIEITGAQEKLYPGAVCENTFIITVLDGMEKDTSNNLNFYLDCLQYNQVEF